MCNTISGDAIFTQPVRLQDSREFTITVLQDRPGAGKTQKTCELVPVAMAVTRSVEPQVLN